MPVVAVVGAGVIGLSWARLFARAGWAVRVSDPRPDLAEVVGAALGPRARAVTDLAEAVSGVAFVQESAPERIEVKRELYARLGELSAEDVVLASSSSSLVASDFAAGLAAADRILVGHPFNPPELIPLVEVVPAPSTSAAAVDRAVEVYRGLGQHPVVLRKEIAGFVGNRLQRAVNDEALFLVQQGVIDVADLDTLVRISLGLRWATIGPFESQHLGGGLGGIRHLRAHVGSQLTFERGVPDEQRVDPVLAEVEATFGTGAEAFRARSAQRDRRTRAVRAALEASDAGAVEGAGADGDGAAR